MPIDWPRYSPDPKSACSGAPDPMKAIMAEEFGSTGAAEMSVFQGLPGVKGTKPLRLAICPSAMSLQAGACAVSVRHARNRAAANNGCDRPGTIISITDITSGCVQDSFWEPLMLVY